MITSHIAIHAKVMTAAMVTCGMYRVCTPNLQNVVVHKMVFGIGTTCQQTVPVKCVGLGGGRGVVDQHVGIVPIKGVCV